MEKISASDGFHQGMEDLHVKYEFELSNIAGQDYIGAQFLAQNRGAPIWGDSWEIYPETRHGIKTEIQYFTQYLF